MGNPDFDGIPAATAKPFLNLGSLELYAFAVLVWGSTWLAIKFQLGNVPPAVSVTWRFAIAAMTLFAYAHWKSLPLAYGWRVHRWFALEGVTMFGINYIGVYYSEQYLTSGLIAVVFSLMAFFNILLMRLFFGAPMKRIDIAGTGLGIAGVVLVFWPEVSQFSAAGGQLFGLALALGATIIASLGNMVATRNLRDGMPVVSVNAWAMMYGAVSVALVALLKGDAFVFDFSTPYVASLLYLSLFGTVLAFGAYVTLMGRIGTGRAGYTSVAIPLVALLLSTLFEELQWEIAMIIGIALCLGGNLLVLSRDKI